MTKYSLAATGMPNESREVTFEEKAGLWWRSVRFLKLRRAVGFIDGDDWQPLAEKRRRPERKWPRKSPEESSAQPVRFYLPCIAHCQGGDTFHTSISFGRKGWNYSRSINGKTFSLPAILCGFILDAYIDCRLQLRVKTTNVHMSYLLMWGIQSGLLYKYIIICQLYYDFGHRTDEITYISDTHWWS